MQTPNPEEPVLHRTIVVGLAWNRLGQLLLCKMSRDRGVFPHQWGLPGGGIEPGERMEQALRRELREELGVEVEDIRPAFFKDGEHEKTFADGSTRQVYMIFLLFHCRAVQDELSLNEEFAEYRWVDEDEVAELDLNEQTRDTLVRLGSWTLPSLNTQSGQQAELFGLHRKDAKIKGDLIEPICDAWDAEAPEATDRSHSD